MENMIIGQVFGIIATLLTFASYQTNKKQTLLIIQSVATICTCLSFLFLGASTGFALNIVCLIRNGVFYFQSKRNTLFYISASLITLAVICVGALSWQGPISLLMIIALAVNTIFIAIGNPQHLRKSILFTSTLVIIYNAFVSNYGGIANEAISIVSSVIGILRYKSKK